jgi:hypothetical protein
MGEEGGGRGGGEEGEGGTHPHTHTLTFIMTSSSLTKKNYYNRRDTRAD